MEHPFVFFDLKISNSFPALLEMNQPWKTILALLILLSLVWGSLMKILVYIFYKKLKILEKPISFLILVNQIVSHILNIFVGLNIVIELCFGLVPTEFARQYLNIDLELTGYCRIFYFLSVFLLGYQIIGNSVLAIYRTLYLKMTAFVTVKIGEEVLMFFSLFGGFFVTGFLTYFFVHEKSSTRAPYNMCVGHSQAFEVIRL
jgi:hypothetical protein